MCAGISVSCRNYTVYLLHLYTLLMSSRLVAPSSALLQGSSLALFWPCCFSLLSWSCWSFLLPSCCNFVSCCSCTYDEVGERINLYLCSGLVSPTMMFLCCAYVEALIALVAGTLSTSLLSNFIMDMGILVMLFVVVDGPVDQLFIIWFPNGSCY